MNFSALLGPISQFTKFIYRRFRQKPVFKIALDTKKLERNKSLVIGIWVKNISDASHNIVKISGEREGYPDTFRISIIDHKYRLPIILSPVEPEKIIVFIGEFLNEAPSIGEECNIIIRVFSRWNDKEFEAGKLKINL